MRKACLPRLRQRRAWAGMNACRTADRHRRRGARSHAQLLQLSAMLDQGFQSACVLMALHRLASPAWLVQLAGKRALYLLSARARFLRGSLDGRYRLAVLFSYSSQFCPPATRARSCLRPREVFRPYCVLDSYRLTRLPSVALAARAIISPVLRAKAWKSTGAGSVVGSNASSSSPSLSCAAGFLGVSIGQSLSVGATPIE